MKGFVWGVIVTLAGLVAAAVVAGVTGALSMRADIFPSRAERAVAMRLMDANVERNAPRVKNPLAGDAADLAAGAEIYRQHCALCHGDPRHPEGALALALNPPAPKFLSGHADMPENENFYIIQHGVRWTAMPGWENVLSERQIWQAVAFLSRMDNLPPAARRVFSAAPVPCSNPPAPAARAK